MGEEVGCGGGERCTGEVRRGGGGGEGRGRGGGEKEGGEGGEGGNGVRVEGKRRGVA